MYIYIPLMPQNQNEAKSKLQLRVKETHIFNCLRIINLQQHKLSLEIPERDAAPTPSRGA